MTQPTSSRARGWQLCRVPGGSLHVKRVAGFSEIRICEQIRTSANEFFNVGEGVILLFFACRPFITMYYDSPETLVLREAGVLLGTLNLVAEALKFSFCPLGTTAENWLVALLGGSENDIIPAGAAVVGRR